MTEPVTPLSQRIELWLDPARTDYLGTTTLEVEVVERLDRVTLDAEGLAVSEAWFDDLPVAVSATGDGIALAVGPVRPGRHTLHMTFAGTLHPWPQGLYRFQSEGEWYVASDFEPDDAGTAWPCFDAPRFKIPYTFVVHAPRQHAMISNRPVDTTGATTTFPPARVDRARAFFSDPGRRPIGLAGRLDALEGAARACAERAPRDLASLRARLAAE